MRRQDDIRPASEDPLGDPADQEQNILPASQDPLGDPGIEGLLERLLGGGSEDDAVEQVDQFQSHPEFGNAVSEELGNMPPEQFQGRAEEAAQQMPAPQIEAVVGNLLSVLQGRGLDVGQLTSVLGLGGVQPQQMGAQDLARLLGWTQRNEPGALGDALRGEPGLLRRLGGPIVMGILLSLARRLLGSPSRA